MANFIAEVPVAGDSPPNLGKDELEWTLFVDGASGSEHQGAGVILHGLEGVEAMKAIKFGFNVTNNVAEYEPLIVGLRLAIRVGVRNLKAHNDSHLVVRQMGGDYGAKVPTLAKYHDLVTKLIQEFDVVNIENMPH